MAKGIIKAYRVDSKWANSVVIAPDVATAIEKYLKHWRQILDKDDWDALEIEKVELLDNKPIS